jgi:hypothetical protein
MHVSFLASALHGGEWSASRFTSAERAAGTHWVGGWVGPIVGLADFEIAISQCNLMCAACMVEENVFLLQAEL